MSPSTAEEAGRWIVEFGLIRFEDTVRTAGPAAAKARWVATGDENLSVCEKNRTVFCTVRGHATGWRERPGGRVIQLRGVVREIDATVTRWDVAASYQNFSIAE